VVGQLAMTNPMATLLITAPMSAEHDADRKRQPTLDRMR
jgi:hypothetical protein